MRPAPAMPQCRRIVRADQTGLALFLSLRLGERTPCCLRSTPSARIAGTRWFGWPSTPPGYRRNQTRRRGRRTWADPTHTRNPMLLLRLSGVFLLRSAQRALSLLLSQEPPRKTYPDRLTQRRFQGELRRVVRS